MEKIPSTNAETTHPFIEDLMEAEVFIHEKWEEGERPVVTVPKTYLSSLENGLKAHTTWIPGTEVIAGTFAREPYLPGDDRVMVTVDVSPDHIRPRLTGPQKAFQGVVVIEGPVPPEAITIH